MFSWICFRGDENICCGYSLEALLMSTTTYFRGEIKIEALLMSTHNICFRGEIRKISAFFGWKSVLTVAMTEPFVWVGIIFTLMGQRGLSEQLRPDQTVCHSSSYFRHINSCKMDSNETFLVSFLYTKPQKNMSKGKKQLSAYMP